MKYFAPYIVRFKIGYIGFVAQKGYCKLSLSNGDTIKGFEC